MVFFFKPPCIALTKLARKSLRYSKSIHFYFCLLFPAVSLMFYSIIGSIIGIIPYFVGYGYHSHAIVYGAFHWMFPYWTGIHVEMDEKSKLLYDSIDEPAIFISNHQTALDIAFIIGMKKLRIRILSKWENIYIPFLGVYSMFPTCKLL